MKFNTDYVEGNCINLGCGGPAHFPQQSFPSQPCFNPSCNPSFPPQFPQQPCPCMAPPSCGYLNFQIPFSLIYLYLGFQLGKNKNLCD